MLRPLLFIFAATFALASCGSRVYDEYRHAAKTGWEKNDTLNFNVPPLRQGGNYQIDLGLRISNEFIFTNVTLIVEATVFPARRIISDTLDCALIRRNGEYIKKGIGYHQYLFSAGQLPLQAGDSLHITVRHDMKRSILPGITDVGILVSKSPKPSDSAF